MAPETGIEEITDPTWKASDGTVFLLYEDAKDYEAKKQIYKAEKILEPFFKGEGVKARKLLDRFPEIASILGYVQKDAPPSLNRRLTKREKEVAFLVGRGWMNKKIALCTGLKEQSIKNLVSEILKKEKLESRVQLALRVNGVEI